MCRPRRRRQRQSKEHPIALDPVLGAKFVVPAQVQPQRAVARLELIANFRANGKHPALEPAKLIGTAAVISQLLVGIADHACGHAYWQVLLIGQFQMALDAASTGSPNAVT
jgi:hypothetical protein